ncbi:MAG: RNA polymerase factor sigma-32 [Rhodospirillales bacterium]|nr:RNA polymerase factor sigma-32 [Rhodospirillales bacterium]
MSHAVLKSLMQIILHQPRLSLKREQELLRKFKQGDNSVVNELVSSHLRFVLHIARRYKNYGHPLSELMQEGTVGLIEAVKRFNPEKKTRLSTYAMWWIRASIQDYVIRSRSLVKIGTTAAQKSLFFNIRRLRPEWHWEDALPEDLARNLANRFNTSISDVLNFARRIGKTDKSLNVPVKKDTKTHLLEQIADNRPDPEYTLMKKMDGHIWKNRLFKALSALPPRETFIIKQRFLSDIAPTRSDLGKKLGLSKERVRQLEIRALDKLKETLKPLRENGEFLEITQRVNLKHFV